MTEGALIENPEQAQVTLNNLKALGLQLGLDDFGTGYSSFSYLQRFRFDRIKIDRSFVENLDRDPDSAMIVRAVVRLGYSLRMEVLAEGVETPGQLQALRQYGCDELQGFMLGRPVPAGSLAPIIQAKTAAAALARVDTQ